MCSLYRWKGISKIYNFTVIGFEKFHNNFSHLSGLISGTLSTSLKNTTPQPRVEELGTELTEAYKNYKLITFSFL
jgi:hypothetical protein